MHDDDNSPTDRTNWVLEIAPSRRKRRRKPPPRRDRKPRSPRAAAQAAYRWRVAHALEPYRVAVVIAGKTGLGPHLPLKHLGQEIKPA